MLILTPLGQGRCLENHWVERKAGEKWRLLLKWGCLLATCDLDPGVLGTKCTTWV